MKRILLFIALIGLFQQCSQDDTVEQQLKSKITFNLSSPSLAGGRVESGGIAGVSAVVISVTSSAGDEILSHKRIAITSFGDGFITEPVEMEVGHYKVADFFLVDDTGNVLYASPHKGSYLGKLLKHPLDQEFAVVRNKNTNLDVEVVSVEGMTPEDFGYKSFSVTALEFFTLSVHVITNGKPAFTKADAIVLKGTDTLSITKTTTGPTLIKFNSDVNDSCQLVIIKDGYGRYTQKFTLRGLKTSLNNKPLDITLQPALTFRFVNISSEEQFSGDAELYFGTEQPASIKVDWGTGQIDELNGINGDAWANTIYPFGNEYFVSVTGDIDKITNFLLDPTIFRMYKLNLNAVIGLKYADYYVRGPEDLLDLRFNTKLERLSPSGDSLILPKVNNINSVYLNQFMGCIEKGQLEMIVDNIYKNAVAHNTRDGRFFYSQTAYDPDPDLTWNGNSKFMNQLRELQDKYHWWVLPRVLPKE